MVTLKDEPNSAQWLPKWHTGGHALLYVGVQRKEETGDMPHYAATREAVQRIMAKDVASISIAKGDNSLKRI